LQGNPVYRTVQCKIDWASTCADLFYGSDRTLSIAGMVKYDDERLPLGDTVPLVQEDHIALIDAEWEDYVDKSMPVDGRKFTEWLILAQQGGPEWALSNNIVQRLDMTGSTVNYKRHAYGIQQNMLDKGYWDASQAMTGQYYVNFLHGALGNAVDSSLLEAKLAVANPSGVNLDRLRVYTRGVYA
jgi:hypothetical protein